jgi:hypothetical protein
MTTHTMPLGEINTAFDLMRNGESIRGVLVYWIGPMKPKVALNPQ